MKLIKAIFKFFYECIPRGESNHVRLTARGRKIIEDHRQGKETRCRSAMFPKQQYVFTSEGLKPI